MTKSSITPLSAFERLIYPLKLLASRGDARELLQRRKDLTDRIEEKRAAKKRLIMALQKESRLFLKLVTDCYIRIGEAYMLAGAGLATGGHVPNRHKVQRVRFSHILFNEERIFFQIQINRRFMHTTRNALPHLVFAANLVSDTSLFELKHATRRLVTASYEDPRKGCWLIVHRLMGMDGIPLQVTYRELLEFFPVDRVADVPLMIGAGENRKLCIFDLAGHPHLLTGGSTGSGKSNFLNNLICNILRFSHPKDVQLILIDLKRLEFGYYRHAPHLMRPIVSDEHEALEVLDFAYKEILRRLELMEDDSKELTEYNEKHPDRKMPRVVIVIDEFAQLMHSDERKAVEILVTRLTNLGRAPGIHVIIATQRPAREVVPNSIKINMPLAVAGRVQNYDQSKVIISTGDAASLPAIPGRMLCLSGANLTPVQTPYVDKADIAEALSIAAGRALGIITLDGFEPVIVPEILIAHIADRLDGKLTAASLKTLIPLGVPGRALKNWVEALVMLGEARSGDRLFKLVKREGNYWALQEVGRESEPVNETVEQPARTPEDAVVFLSYERPPLEAAGVPQSLPDLDDTIPYKYSDEIIPAPEPEPVTKPDPAPPFMHPLAMDDDQLLDLFIERRCIKGPRYSATSAELHRAFESFCKELDDQIVPINSRSFGQRLSKRGFEKFLTNGPKRANAWKGLKLRENIPNIQNEQPLNIDAA